ncbi:MAG TPA: ribonuclease III [Candidatus Paceibacterota bacterium]
MPKKELSDFEKIIGVSFKNKDLLKQAFVHRSYLNEHKKFGLEHNERLEFLGDAVLELIVTDFLYRKFTDKTEGDLTSYRSALVNTNTLAQEGEEIEMGQYLLLSKGEAKDTGRARQYIIANAFEALIGAMYMDQGYEVAQDFIARTLFKRTDEIVEKRLWQDAKSRFQEKAQDAAGTTPSYKTIEERGPDHDKYFKIGVFLGKELIAEGEGKSKQEAEQDAAANGLKVKNW